MDIIETSRRSTLEYAATALEGSADNGDQYCAWQIRQMLSMSARPGRHSCEPPPDKVIDGKVVLR